MSIFSGLPLLGFSIPKTITPPPELAKADTCFESSLRTTSRFIPGREKSNFLDSLNEDLQSILIYIAATGEYICEAWLMEKDSRYTIADVKQARDQARRGLLERQKFYAEEIYEKDRRMARKESWKQARELEKENRTIIKIPDSKKPHSTENNPSENDLMEQVKAKLEKMEKRDRGIL